LTKLLPKFGGVVFLEHGVVDTVWSMYYDSAHST